MVVRSNLVVTSIPDVLSSWTSAWSSYPKSNLDLPKYGKPSNLNDDILGVLSVCQRVRIISHCN